LWPAPMMLEPATRAFIIEQAHERFGQRKHLRRSAVAQAALMPTAVPAKPGKINLGALPRLVRQKPKPAPLLGDDSDEALDEKTYRARLWNEFVRYCRENNAWVVSPPHEGHVRVQPAEDSRFLERLAQLPRYPVAILPDTSQQARIGKSNSYQIKV